MDNIKIGDIMVTYAGGENWFYKVLKVNPKSLKVRMLEKEYLSESRERPTDKYCDWTEVETARIKIFDDGDKIALAPHSRDWLDMYNKNYNYFFQQKY